jgi:hypothetical protein
MVESMEVKSFQFVEKQGKLIGVVTNVLKSRAHMIAVQRTQIGKNTDIYGRLP